MPTKTENFIKAQLKSNVPDIRPGDTVKVHQKIKEKDKERIQTFEGLVIARKHGKEAGATITVRRVVSGVGVEKIIPVHSPVIDKLEIVKRGKVRRAKLYYIRKARGRKARLKKQDFVQALPQEPQEEVQIEAEKPAGEAEKKEEPEKKEEEEEGK